MQLSKKCALLFLLMLGMISSMTCFAENIGDKSDKNKDRETKTVISDSIYDVQYVDTHPEFPGGNGEFKKYISNSMNYPDKARTDAIEGIVIIKMIVDENGTILDSMVAYSADPLFEKEALRLVKKMPKWKPGQKDGKKVNVRVTLPILFKL